MSEPTAVVEYWDGQGKPEAGYFHEADATVNVIDGGYDIRWDGGEMRVLLIIPKDDRDE